MSKPSTHRAALPGLPAVLPATVGFDAMRLERIADVIEADVATGTLAGAVVLVARHGQVAWHRAFGLEDPSDPARSPMRKASVFRIGAMTRAIVAVATLVLVERGQLALADRLDRFLPEFEKVRVGVEIPDSGLGQGRLTLESPRRPITILDLLRHTSGLTYGIFGDSLVQRMYREARVLDPMLTNAEMVRRLAELPLQNHPGGTFEYGMSTDVLGRVLEVVCGCELAQVVERLVTEPLKMADTGFHLKSRAGAGLARPLAKSGSPGVLFDYDPSHPPSLQLGGAGLLSTAADYARFCQMLLERGTLDGARLLSRKSVDLMLADQLPPGIAFGTSTAGLGINAPTPDFGQGHGLGVGVRRAAGLAPVPGSVGDFFWGGVLGTYFWADPVEQIVAVLMLQENDAAVRTRHRVLLRNLVYGALDDRASSEPHSTRS